MLISTVTLLFTALLLISSILLKDIAWMDMTVRVIEVCFDDTPAKEVSIYNTRSTSPEASGMKYNFLSDAIQMCLVSHYQVSLKRRSANTYGPDVIGPDVKGPDMIGPGMIRPDVIGPDMIGPDLRGSGVIGPDLRGPDVTGPDLIGPDMIDPDLMGPDVIGPDMIGPDVMGPDVICPDLRSLDVIGSDMIGPDVMNEHLPIQNTTQSTSLSIFVPKTTLLMDTETLFHFVIIFGISIICAYLNEFCDLDRCGDLFNRQENGVGEMEELVATVLKTKGKLDNYILPRNHKWRKTNIKHRRQKRSSLKGRL